MNFIYECFEKNSAALIEKLTGTGFSPERARQFIYETAAGMTATMKSPDADKAITSLLSEEPTRLLQLFNVNSMANKLDMNAGQVQAGLETIAPVVSQMFSNRGDCIVEDTASLACGSKDDFISATNKYFFKKP